MIALSTGLFRVVAYVSGAYTVELTWDPNIVACTRDSESLKHRYDESYKQHPAGEASSEHIIGKFEVLLFVFQMMTLMSSFAYLTFALCKYYRASRTKVGDSHSDSDGKEKHDKAVNSKEKVENILEGLNQALISGDGSKTSESGESSLFPEDQVCFLILRDVNSNHFSNGENIEKR